MLSICSTTRLARAAARCLLPSTVLLGLGCLLLAGCTMTLRRELPKEPEQRPAHAAIDRGQYDTVEGYRQAIRTEPYEQNTPAAFKLQMGVELETVCAMRGDWQGVKRELTLETPSVDNWQPPNPQVDAMIDRYSKMVKAVDFAYARFQDYRKLQSEIPHDMSLLQSTVQQGLLVLFEARGMLNFHEGMEELGCSVKPFDYLVEVAKSALSDVADGQLPSLLNQLEPTLDNWAWSMLRVEFDVLSGKDTKTQCLNWYDTLASGEVAYDTPILAWCGYALFTGGDAENAKRFLKQAGQTIHDPEMASFALKQLRYINEHAKSAKVRQTAELVAE